MRYYPLIILVSFTAMMVVVTVSTAVSARDNRCAKLRLKPSPRAATITEGSTNKLSWSVKNYGMETISNAILVVDLPEGASFVDVEALGKDPLLQPPGLEVSDGGRTKVTMGLATLGPKSINEVVMTWKLEDGCLTGPQIDIKATLHQDIDGELLCPLPSSPLTVSQSAASRTYHRDEYFYPLRRPFV